MSDQDDAVTSLTSLLKAETGKEDDEEKGDEYNEAYMKKYMTKYMKENPKDTEGMGYTKKAFDVAVNTAQSEADNTGADMVVVDGTQMIKAFGELGNNLLKSILSITAKVDEIEKQVITGNTIQKAAGSVLIKAQESIDKIGKTPQLLKSNMVGEQSNPIPDTVLEKAKEIGMVKAKGLLLKAAMGGNKRAGDVMGQVEGSNGNWNMLSPNSIKYIVDIGTQEGNK